MSLTERNQAPNALIQSYINGQPEGVGFQTVMKRAQTGDVTAVTSDDALAQATKLDWAQTSAPIPHGGLKIKLYQAEIL